MTDKLVEQVRNIINEQVIDWACKEGMTKELLDRIIGEEIIPVIRKAVAEEIKGRLEGLLWKEYRDDLMACVVTTRERWQTFWGGLK